MPAYKYKKGGKTMWYAKINFQDADGINRQHCKRGFKKCSEAEAYETEYKTALKLCPSTGAPSLTELLQSILSANNIAVPTAAQEPVEEPKEPERTFQMVFDEYWAATIAKGIKAGTKETKRNMLEQHILPYFKDLELTAITAAVIKQWQEEVQQKERRGKKFTPTYLHSIQSQLNAVLNYAVRKKYLPFSPMVDLKNMGEKNAAPREIWTPDEYARFAQYAKTRPETFRNISPVMLFLSALQRAWIDQSSKVFGAHRSLAFLNSCGVLVLPYRTPPRCRLVKVKQGAFYPVARQSGTVAASLTVYKLVVLSFLQICCCGRAAIGTALSCGVWLSGCSVARFVQCHLLSFRVLLHAHNNIMTYARAPQAYSAVYTSRIV